WLYLVVVSTALTLAPNGGFGSGSAGDQSSRVLTVPVSIWIRRLTDGRRFIRVPRLGVGYRFGDGLSGLSIRIGGDRVTRLPLP
ncbi:MAG: hypothetical protein WBN79_06475, partial [Gemmatimonadota bacterium]